MRLTSKPDREVKTEPETEEQPHGRSGQITEQMTTNPQTGYQRYAVTLPYLKKNPVSQECLSRIVLPPS